MKKLLLSSLIISSLVGCSSSVSTPNLDQFSHHSGGKSMGDATSFYWYTERLSQSYTAGDYVFSGDYGWYKTDYRWNEGEVRELIREGEQIRQDVGLVPYRVHVRFNVKGEAVYQQYRIDDKVLPINEEQLLRYQQEAKSVAEVTKEFSRDGIELIQGYWDGSRFESCGGQSYEGIEFNQTLPGFVVNRLAEFDSYVAVLGKIRSNKVIIEDLLMLNSDSHDCVERPRLIESN
ncbi:DUF1481 domain-containing protein [Vibrio sp. ZSDE26]|uniref:DUF1481 domain-containing protein n=1 Tax=Vibrio amylolyticus TaxID=2847292 RepID=A0A9X1XQE1_9VIBR|nr:DUF1481 domain-containing protein [Vibrio amylolyticus]MCK6265303.1 DUF1481 domain-containing protein [Vibrio amylolyticus]